MNKTQALTNQAARIINELTAHHLIAHIDIFYGDCDCVYVGQQGKSIGWHMEVESVHEAHEDYARYLGENYARASERLYGVLSGIVREYESVPLPMDGEDIPQ